MTSDEVYFSAFVRVRSKFQAGLYFHTIKQNKNGKSKSCLEMSNSLIGNALTSKLQNVCFCGHPNVQGVPNVLPHPIAGPLELIGRALWAGFEAAPFDRSVLPQFPSVNVPPHSSVRPSVSSHITGRICGLFWLFKKLLPLPNSAHFTTCYMYFTNVSIGSISSPHMSFLNSTIKPKKMRLACKFSFILFT